MPRKSATEATALRAMSDAATQGKPTEADLVQAGIAALVKKSMPEATARSVAQIVYNAHFRVWEGA